MLRLQANKIIPSLRGAIMKKSYVVVFSLLIACWQIITLSAIKNECTFATETVKSRESNLKKLIDNEMLQVRNSIDNKEKLKEIWYEGTHRNTIQKILAQKNRLGLRDLKHLRYLIHQEKKIIPSKITRIADIVNQSMSNNLNEAFMFKKTEAEIEGILKEVSISADELIKEEYQTYDKIIGEITREINSTYAHNQKVVE